MSNEQSKNSNQSNENCKILTNKRKKEKSGSRIQNTLFSLPKTIEITNYFTSFYKEFLLHKNKINISE